MSAFKENKIDIATKTMVKEVKEKSLVAQNEKKELVEYPYGLLVWYAPSLDTFRPIADLLLWIQGNRKHCSSSYQGFDEQDP